MEKVVRKAGHRLIEIMEKTFQSKLLEEAILMRLRKKGTVTIEQLALELKVSREEIKKTLDLLIIEGKIAEKEAKLGCTYSCSSCPLKNFCLYIGANNSSIIYYFIKDQEE